MLREILLSELIKLHKSVEKNDYKNAKLSSMRIHSLCDAFIPTHKQQMVNNEN